MLCKIKYYISFSILLFSITTICFSQTKNDEPASSTMFFLYMSMPTISTLNDEAAEREGLNQQITGVDFGMDFTFYRMLVFGGDLGIEFPSDNKEFSQNTTQGRMSSSVTMPYTSIYTGLRSPAIALGKGSSKHLILNLLLGRTWLFNARRSIDNCKDCRKDEIDIDITYFLEPGLDFAYITDSGTMFGVGMKYELFYKSEYQHRLGLKFFIGTK